MSVMSVRIPDELANQLSLLAEATGRTKSYLAGQAIQDFLDREAWQITEIKQAIIEADQQDFVSENEMSTLFKKWVWPFRIRINNECEMAKESCCKLTTRVSVVI